MSGRTRIRAALAELLPEAAAPEALAVAGLLGDHLDDYAELTLRPAAGAAGFLTRGEERLFTERTQLALAALGLEAAALAHHRALADAFGHTRGFVALEWSHADGRTRPRALCRFRRRPAIADVLAQLAAWGVAAAARDYAAEVADLLAKDSVHFVGAAFAPASEVGHELTFSQWLTPATRAAVATRLGRVLARAGVLDGEAASARWQAAHERCLPAGDATLFVTIGLGRERPAPGVVVDYPAVAPADAAAWADAAAGDAARACALAGSERVAFLGVRHGSGGGVALEHACVVAEAA